jgi:Cof subfamily protein (haloacid dehalogenase superfamily)
LKCIATDMDGTLLNEYQMVSEENRKALEAVRDNGGQVIVATGRSYKEARFALDEINFQCPIISLNGAAVYNQKGELMDSNPMQQESLFETVKLLEEMDLYFEMYTNRGTFSKNPEKAIDSLVDIFLSANPDQGEERIREFAEGRIKFGFIFATDDYFQLINEEDIEIYKILVFSTDLNKLKNVAAILGQAESLTVTSSGKGNIEINQRGVSKGTALENVLKKLQIPLEETIAIGDNLNDVSMFEKAGLSVAMGNASDDIKRLCKDVSLTNEEHGVAHIIYKYIVEK